MQAMVLKKLGTALEWTELPDRQPGPGEIRVKVGACGVCRTDLHVVDGELPNPHLPIIRGHEIVGRIDAIGAGVEGLRIGERVGIPWLGHTCGVCPYCMMHPIFTGFTRDGGYATATIADARFAFPLGEVGSEAALAPLLCAGLIGWRSLVIAGDGKKLDFMALVPRPISWRRWRSGRGARCLLSRGREMSPPRASLEASARHGLADPTRCRRSRSMLLSSLRPSAISCPWHSRQFAKAVVSFVPAST